MQTHVREERNSCLKLSLWLVIVNYSIVASLLSKNDYSWTIHSFFCSNLLFLLQRVERSNTTQKGFERFPRTRDLDFSHQYLSKAEVSGSRLLAERKYLIVLHLASCQLCHMMIKCAFTEKVQKSLNYSSKTESLIRETLSCNLKPRQLTSLPYLQTKHTLQRPNARKRYRSQTQKHNRAPMPLPGTTGTLLSNVTSCPRPDLSNSQVFT